MAQLLKFRSPQKATRHLAHQAKEARARGHVLEAARLLNSLGGSSARVAALLEDCLILLDNQESESQDFMPLEIATAQ